MSERGERLHGAADAQVAELIRLIARADRDSLHRPVPGREKLGDGTLAALVQHTADNYRRIADFALADDDDVHPARGGRRILRLLRVPGHRPPQGHGRGPHAHSYVAAEVDPEALGRSLATTRERLAPLARLEDDRLDAAPPAGSFRFCDGRRTREEVFVALLDHQRHQLEAIRTAVG